MLRQIWTYKGTDVFPAARNASGVRWTATTPDGDRLRADTKDGMRALITASVTPAARNDANGQ
jgi:hypothetical protein